MNRSLLPALLLLAAPAFAPAQESLPPGAKVAKLDARPAKVALTTPFAYSQLLVTATLESGDTIDVTRAAKVDAPKFVTVSATGLVRPTADGTGELAVSVGGKALKIPVTATGTKSEQPVSFTTDVEPVLSKLGCNAGTCHGAQAGKNGFKLSLRGYDPLYDFRALTDDLEGRRFNRAAPDRSLMLLKTDGAVAHQGGVLMNPGDPNYEMIRRWIAQGVKLDLAAPRVASIEVFPKNPMIARIGGKQQFAVVATYTDGRVRDVSAEAFIDSSNTDVAKIDKAGLLTTERRGEATMLARYEGAYAASTVVVLGDRSGFAWEPRPVHNFIDELVDAKLKRVKVQPSPLADDAEFVRRVYLDLTGLPPTAEEVKAFVADKTDGRAKREALIDKLIGGEAFVEHWTNKWADLLQVNRKFLGDVGAAALRKWIREAVADNAPYDKFVHDILTASGSNAENPPAAYYKILRTPDAVMENTTQLFLAIRFNCNKCHDHPFERWTQDQYYQMAAYFAQVDRKEDPKFKGQKLGGTAVEGAKPLVEVIADAKGGDVTHERTGLVTAPKFPYDIAAKLPAEPQRRAQAADWITSPKNPYFAKSFVNRVWSYLLGVGIIEPVDDIRAGNPPTNPELLDKLTEEFVASGFNTRKLIRTICKSRTYQLAVATNKWNADDDINYSHAQMRRLPAEVLFDAIHVATGSASKIPGLPAGARAAQLLDSNVNLPGGFLELFGKPVRESACECERSSGMNLGPILAMVNGPVVLDAVHDPNNAIAKLVAGQTDDAKVVEEVYLRVLSRKPTAAEAAEAVKAVRGAGADLKLLKDRHDARVAALRAYEKTLPDRQKAYEETLKTQRPTEWVPLENLKAVSKAGATPAVAKSGSKLTVQKDGSILASGTLEPVDLYTVTGTLKAKDPVTAVRIEALADDSLPKKGPGRAESGNFVLNELRLNHRQIAKPDDKPKPIRLNSPQATFEQGGFPAANAIDNNPATGWAVFPNVGRDHAALFRFAQPVPAANGEHFTVVLEHRFGSGHNLGKFRVTVTTDKNPKLTAPLGPDVLAILDTPADKRTDAQKARLQQMYVNQDQELGRLRQEAATPPPSDPRVLGAQDLVWALINTPAFLFNH